MGCPFNLNIGGFVLIRLADLIARAPAAQTMLVVVGSLSAVIAGLVMMTRISIKVRLAWSTCAQMGFMLMEVGLGLYELALLHLVAHSLYKAYAFLNAGDTVLESRRNDLLPGRQPPRSLWWYLAALALSAAAVSGSITLWRYFLPELHLPIVAGAVVALGLAPLLWLEQEASAALIGRALLQITALTQLYLGWHLLFAGLTPAADTTAAVGLLVWAGFCFGLLYAVQIWLRRYPLGRLSRTLYPWAYCGFYLDDLFSRLLFRFWPTRLNPAQAQIQTQHQPDHRGEMA